MKIAFDLDGVLCDIDIPALNAIRRLYEGEERLKEDILYYMSRKPILNPEDFLHEGDEYIVITARYDDLWEVSKKWLDKYCPNHSDFFMVGSVTGYSEKEKWTDLAARAKISIMEKEGVDIYFDDNPRFVEKYRNLTKIPIIQYGGRYIC